MNPFYSKLSEKISDLILAVIALGLLVVSVEHVQFLTDFPGTMYNPEFWKRLALILLVIIFTAYKFIAYWPISVSRITRPRWPVWGHGGLF